MIKYRLFFVLAILLICGVFAVALVGIGPMDGILDDGAVRKGLDLVGGSVIVYEAVVEEDMTAEELATDMQAVQNMMVNRLTALNYTEATVTLEGDRRVRIEIPSIDDPETASQMLGSTAKLEFQNAEGETILEGKDVKRAEARYGQVSENGIPQYYVALEFQAEAVPKFADATRYASDPLVVASGKNYIAILLDGEVLSSPYVHEELNTDSCVITGSFTQERASWLASVITAGQLPFALQEVQLQAIGPTLGELALSTSVLAGSLGILLVIVFMSIYYRLPGVMASLSLIVYTGLVGILLVVTKVNLSLPGIAGIILSIGMAVDANVIIFERIKEELIEGKSTNAAFHGGFHRAFSSILDSNVTTLITVIVLMVFGSGSIVGFAQTLLIGVLVSFFTAIVVTRFLLSCLVGMRLTKPSQWGLRKRELARREEAVHS
ncbi:MAG: protein translocase subunit SecD [Clostridia bacterium]|nr:protein translocase subunit SecD [Clostridia bacterium]